MMQDGMEMRVGESFMVVGEKLLEMKDSTRLFLTRDFKAIKQVLDRDGYVLLRGVLDKDSVMKAREIVTGVLSDQFDAIDESETSRIDAKIKNDKKGILLTGYSGISNHEQVKQLLEGNDIVNLMRSIFGEDPSTFTMKWCRVKGCGEYTDEHSDYYRFSASSAINMYTCWSPLGSYTPHHGTLVVCEKSHTLAGYSPECYDSESKIELPPDFEEFNENATWRTTSFAPGDVVVFDIRLVHASTMNMTSFYRISMDTRWQPHSSVSTKNVPNFVRFTDLNPSTSS